MKHSHAELRNSAKEVSAFRKSVYIVSIWSKKGGYSDSLQYPHPAASGNQKVHMYIYEHMYIYMNIYICIYIRSIIAVSISFSIIPIAEYY